MSDQAPARVIAFPRRPEHEPKMTYRQLAAALVVSERFLKYRVREGMPNLGLDYAGRRRFLLSEAIAWLDARNTSLGRGRIGDAQSPPSTREEQ